MYNDLEVELYEIGQIDDEDSYELFHALMHEIDMTLEEEED